MTKFQFIKYLFFGCSFLFFGCTSETLDPATIEIIIKAKYKDQALVFNPANSYEYFDGSVIRLTRSEFFINNIKLISNTGESKDIGELKHVRFDLTQINEQKAQDGVKLSFDAFAEGNYERISFEIGLNPALNKTSPINYKLGHVLYDPENYWDGWNSYIFARVEGNVQDKNGKTALFAYHCGFDESLRKVELNKEISIINGQKNTIILELDHSQFFGNSSNYLNIFANPIIHENNALIQEFMNHFSKSFK